jgi:ligand-binding sensor domain-containing protein
MRNKILLLIILGFISALVSCSNPKVTAPESGKTIYDIPKAISAGSSWNLKYSGTVEVGPSLFSLNDISSDETGNIYYATTGGVFRINPIDSSAKRLENGLIYLAPELGNTQYAGALLYNNKRLFVGSSNLSDDGGIITLNDFGENFQGSFEYNRYFNAVSIYKNPNGEIFAGCYNDIYRSTNNGTSWESETINTDAGFTYFYSFTFDKYGNIYGATARGVYYSDSKQIKFKSIGLAAESILGIDITSEGWIYASTDNGELYSSKDSGASWKKINNYPVLQAKCIYINKNNYIFAGTTSGIFRSKDYGDTWEFVGLRNEYVQRIISDFQGNMIAGTYMQKIYISSE